MRKVVPRKLGEQNARDLVSASWMSVGLHCTPTLSLAAQFFLGWFSLFGWQANLIFGWKRNQCRALFGVYYYQPKMMRQRDNFLTLLSCGTAQQLLSAETEQKWFCTAKVLKPFFIRDQEKAFGFPCVFNHSTAYIIFSSFPQISCIFMDFSPLLLQWHFYDFRDRNVRRGFWPHTTSPSSHVKPFQLSAGYR